MIVYLYQLMMIVYLYQLKMIVYLYQLMMIAYLHQLMMIVYLYQLMMIVYSYLYQLKMIIYLIIYRFRCEGSARIFGVGIGAFDPSLPGITNRNSKKFLLVLNKEKIVPLFSICFALESPLGRLNPNEHLFSPSRSLSLSLFPYLSR
jgi:hypothetical protein